MADDSPNVKKISPDLVKQFGDFTVQQVGDLGSVAHDPNALVWHYTDGSGLLGILRTSQLYSTQAACLNDSTELLYAEGLFRKALTEIFTKFEGDNRIKEFVGRYLTLLEEKDPKRPSHAGSRFCVTCFSGEEDSLTQWLGYSKGENGYALGFRSGNLNKFPLLKVNYDAAVHEKIAVSVAEATVKFYQHALEDDPSAAWETDFIENWALALSYLAPLVKDPGFNSEREFRLIHEFRQEDLVNVVILQKRP